MQNDPNKVFAELITFPQNRVFLPILMKQIREEKKVMSGKE
jgi:hypothetical protein